MVWIQLGTRLGACLRHTCFNQIYIKRFSKITGDLFVMGHNKELGNIIDGKSLSEKVLKNVKLEVNKWVSQGNRAPHLSVVLVGEDPASKVYVKNKFIAANKCGITSNVINCPSTITQNELLDVIKKLNSDDLVDAILLQLPCPVHINEKALLDSICKYKDVDGFHPTNIANFTLREDEGIVPCTALAVREILQELNITTKGLRAVVIGFSRYIALPIFLVLSSPPPTGFDMTTTVCNIHTTKESLDDILQKSDVVVSVVGKPGLIKGDLIKPGAIVIDVGISVINESGSVRKVVGDVEFEKAREKAGYITPVPGGVGPLTVAMLMRNTLQCAVLSKNRKSEENGRTIDSFLL